MWESIHAIYSDDNLSLYVSAMKLPELAKSIDSNEDGNRSTEFKTPLKTHAMFVGTCDMGMLIFSVSDYFSYISLLASTLV